MVTAADNAIAIMIKNLGNQIIAFQLSIEAREPGQRFPGVAEVGILVKLINCLDKLRKFLIPANNNKEMNNFIRFLKNTDKELAQTVAGKYKEYAAGRPIQQPIIPETDTADLAYTPDTIKMHPEPEAEQMHNCTNTEKNRTKVPDENKTYILSEGVVTPCTPVIPEGKEHENIIIPMPPASCTNDNEYYELYNPKDRNSPELLRGPFDGYITRQDLDKQPISLRDYNNHWELINDPCKFTNEVLISAGYYKLYVLQYKLRYIHYILQIEAYNAQHVAIAA